jgi:hypothetical protein
VPVGDLARDSVPDARYRISVGDRHRLVEDGIDLADGHTCYPCCSPDEIVDGFTRRHGQPPRWIVYPVGLEQPTSWIGQAAGVRVRFSPLALLMAYAGPVPERHG